MIARGGDYSQPWANAQDAIKPLKAQLGDFCATVAQLSKDNAPPAMNAASGYFREAMWSGKELVPLASPYPGALASGDGKELYDLIVQFGQSLKSAFAPENVSATGFTNSKLFIDSVEQLGREVGAVVKDVISLFAGKADYLKLEKDVKDLIDKTKNLGVKLNGTHANGWISKNVKGAAEQIKSSATALEGSLTDQEAKAFAGLIRNICAKIKAIPDFQNDPWLYGEWQIEFQAIMDAAGQGAKAEAAAA